MKRHVDDTLRRLAALDFPQNVPPRAQRPPWEHASEIIDQPRFTRRRVLVAASLTVVAVSSSVVVANKFGPSSTPIATPPLLTIQPASGGSPFTVLTGLADRAGKQPPPGGHGQVFYTKLREWAFGTSVTTAMRFIDAGLAEYHQEVWLNPDGKGRILRVEQGREPAAAGGPSRIDAPFTSQPHPAVADMGKATTEELTARLLEEGKGRTTGDWFETAAKIWTDRLDDPATGAALLHVLASLPDVTVEGATTDRAGRAAIAISTPVEKPGGWFPKQRQYLLVDPETGYLLATESVGLSSDEDAIGGPVDTPATIHYKVWLKSAFVTDTQTRP